MTWLPDTIGRLLAAGYNPIPLEEAANRCFNAVGPNGVRSGLYSSDATTGAFWQEFMRAAKVLRGGGEEMREAA